MQAALPVSFCRPYPDCRPGVGGVYAYLPLGEGSIKGCGYALVVPVVPCLKSLGLLEAVVKLLVAGHVADLAEDHLADQSRRCMPEGAEISALEGERGRILGRVQCRPGEQVGQSSPDVLVDSRAESRFQARDELDEPVMTRVEPGQVEQLVHAVHGGEGEPFVEPVVQLSGLRVGLGLRSGGVEHQVLRQHLEVQVAEERHVGHGTGQLVDELARRSSTAGRVAQGEVQEHGCGAQPGQQGAVELVVLCRGEEALVAQVGAQMDGPEVQVVHALWRDRGVRGDLDDDGCGEGLRPHQVGAEVVRAQPLALMREASSTGPRPGIRWRRATPRWCGWRRCSWWCAASTSAVR